MRKVLIADDEPLIVTGLSEKLDWDQMGCQVAGSATNGLEAQRLLEKLDPDILLTDIVMPGKTGLELAAWLKAQGRRTRVILLSTYDHFDYAREGIRMGVCDYILKPIDKEKLREAIKKALEALDDQTRLTQGTTGGEAGGKGEVSPELLFEAAQYGLAAIPSEARLRGLFSQGMVVCMKAYNEPLREDFCMLRQMRKAMTKALEENGLPCYSRSIGQMLVFIIPLKDPTMAIGICGYARRTTRQMDGITICVAAASPSLFPLEELHINYKDCVKRVKQAYFATESGLWQRVVPQSQVMVQQELDEIRSALTNGSHQRMEAAFEAMCVKLRAGCDPEHAAHSLREAYRLATASASLAGMVEKPAFVTDRLEENFESRRSSVGRYMGEICAFIRQSQDVAGRLRLLMKENYPRPDFSLGEAAELMGMSVPYLSRLFKKELGENFQEMLVSLRIAKARELLAETALRHHEIASQVGFEDERYFGQVFRRRCGMTPGQFRAETKKSQQ